MISPVNRKMFWSLWGQIQKYDTFIVDGHRKAMIYILGGKSIRHHQAASEECA
jgi:hypothetical protein